MENKKNLFIYNGESNKTVATCACGCGKMLPIGTSVKIAVSACLLGKHFNTDCLLGDIVGDVERGSNSKRCINHVLTASIYNFTMSKADKTVLWADLVTSYGCSVVVDDEKHALHVTSPLYTSNQPSSNLWELFKQYGCRVYCNGVYVADDIAYKKATDRKAPRF